MTVAVGQEHRFGRWDKFYGCNGVQNCVKVIHLPSIIKSTALSSSSSGKSKTDEHDEDDAVDNVI